MMIYKDITVIVFGFAVINAILFIPQAMKIWKEETAKDVSLITFTGFWLTQLAIVIYAVFKQDYLLIIGYLFSMLTCGVVIFLVVNFRKRQGDFTKGEEITLEDVIKQLPGHLYWKNRHGIFLGSNTQNWKEFGLQSLEEFLGKTDHDLFPKEQAEKLSYIDNKVMETGKQQVAEELCNLSDGRTALYLSHKAPLINRSGKIIGCAGVSLDITEAKRAELDRLTFLETIIALMPGHVYWVDRNGVYQGCNDEQARSAGLKNRKEIIGKRNKDLPWNINIGDILEEIDKANQDVMASGKAKVIEEPAELRDGTKAIFLSNKVPIKDRTGQVTGMVGISIDITAKKEAELLKLEKLELEKQINKEKREAAETLANRMQTLAATIAHELRTPLGTIDSSATLLELICTDINNKEIRKNLLDIHHLIFEETKKANSFINIIMKSMRDLNNILLEEMSIRNCVVEAIDRFPYEVGKKMLINYQGVKDFNFRGDKEIMIHVLFNLIKNALYFIEAAAKGEITIWTETNSSDDSEIAKFNYLHFKDTGKGMSQAKADRIFEKFYTDTGVGTGIGLYFCKNAMNIIGGDIICKAKEGEYAHFILSFPLTFTE